MFVILLFFLQVIKELFAPLNIWMVGDGCMKEEEAENDNSFFLPLTCFVFDCFQMVVFLLVKHLNLLFLFARITNIHIILLFLIGFVRNYRQFPCKMFR